MQTIFKALVEAGLIEQLQGSNFFPAQAGKTIFGLFLNLTCFEENKVEFQFEDLIEVRPVQVILELAAHSESSRFQPILSF